MKRDPIEYGKPIPVRLPEEVIARVEAVAKKIGEPRSTIMRMAIRIGLDALEKAVAVDSPKLSSLLYPSKASGGMQLNEGNPPQQRKKKAG